jgi:hypothetical protein
MENRDDLIADNLKKHGWSPLFPNEQPAITGAVPDLVLLNAKRWFHSNGFDSVTFVTEYNTTAMGAASHGYTGRDAGGSEVASVSLGALTAWCSGRTVKPLLVVSFKQALTKDQVDRVNSIISGKLSSVGWTCIAIDCMDEAKVQAFGVDAPGLDTLSTDNIIEILEGLKRVREEAQDGKGVQSPKG